MTKIKFYEFVDCNTCIKALKFLNNRRYAVQKIDIFAHPPSKSEIRKMIGYYQGKYLTLLTPADKRNQETGIQEKAALMSEDEIIELLSANGKLFKRPFVLSKNIGLVGFDEKAWDEAFPK